MSRLHRFDLLRRTSRHSGRELSPRLRRLRSEPLEDRRMLAGVTVNNALDVVNGDTSSIANLIASDGGDGIALREALDAANNTLGADTVTFNASLDGGTILLALGELDITEAVTIDATSLTGDLTIDAQENSRIAHITTTTGDFTFAGLTLTGGKTTAYEGYGGAIRSASSGSLTIDQSTVSGNSTTGSYAFGGGIRAQGDLTITSSTVSGNSTTGGEADGGGISGRGNVTLTDSIVSGNSTAGYSARGGGIRASGDVTLTNSTVDGNSTSGLSADGGGVSAIGSVTLIDSTVSGNSTVRNFAPGGGIRATFNVTLINSTVSGNSTSGYESVGGGISNFYGSVTLTDSTVSGNYTLGGRSEGGGINARSDVTLTNSTVSGNSTSGYFAEGGGIYVRADATITGSTISGNSTSGDFAYGGGISAFGFSSDLKLINSTVSGNSTSGDQAEGGGLITVGNLMISQSTIANNHVYYDNATGGGISNYNKPIVITGSIVADNTAGGGKPDIRPGTGTLAVDYSLIGDTSELDAGQLAEINAGVGNLLDVDPMLGLLADNGGSTETHALLAGSAAINAGAPTFVPPPNTDQRGYYRVAGGRIDMGAYETDSIVPLPGDGNLDGTVDGLDYLLWAANFGDNPADDPPGSPGNGDYNDDGVVDGLDGLDYLVWAGNFGAGTAVAASIIASQPATRSAEELSAVDTALEDDYDIDVTVGDDLVKPSWRTSRAFDSVLDNLSAKRHDHKRMSAAM